MFSSLTRLLDADTGKDLTLSNNTNIKANQMCAIPKSMKKTSIVCTVQQTMIHVNQQSKMGDTHDTKSNGKTDNRKRCIKVVQSLDSFDDSVVSSSSSSSKRRKVLKKQVRFGNINDDKPQVTIIEYLPLCSEYTSAEKVERWMQPLEQSDARSTAKFDAQQFVSSTNVSLPLSQVEAFINGFCYTYHATKQIASTVVSDDSSDNDSHDSTTSVQSLSSSSIGSQAVVSMLQCAPDLLHVLARSDIRGLEDRIVPIIGIDRRIVRKRIIQAVTYKSHTFTVQRKNVIQQMYCNHVVDETIQNELLNQIDTLSTNAIRAQYEEVSHSAKFFAEAVGLIDATAAMIEYTKF